MAGGHTVGDLDLAGAEAIERGMTLFDGQVDHLIERDRVRRVIARIGRQANLGLGRPGLEHEGTRGGHVGRPRPVSALGRDHMAWQRGGFAHRQRLLQRRRRVAESDGERLRIGRGHAELLRRQRTGIHRSGIDDRVVERGVVGRGGGCQQAAQREDGILGGQRRAV